MNEVRRARRDAAKDGSLIITLNAILLSYKSIYFKKERGPKVQRVNRTPSTQVE